MYRNDNGVDVFKLEDSDNRHPEEIYYASLVAHGDDYYETEAFMLYLDEDGCNIIAEIIHLDDIEEGKRKNPGAIPVRDISDYLREAEEAVLD